MTVGIWYRLTLDRIHISMTISSKEFYGIVMGQLEEIKAMQKQLLPIGKIGIRKKEHSTRLDYYPRKKDRKIADIEVGVTPSKQMYLRLGLYPSKFRGLDFEVLKGHLEAFFGHGFYELMYGHGRVSYIELAVDSLKFVKRDLIPFRGRTNHSAIHVNNDGSKGSIYLGGIKSDLRFCIYDKAKQLVDTKQVGHSHHATRTRIEARVRNTKLSPCELVEGMPNVFTGLGLADLGMARQMSDDVCWQKFLDDCEDQGSAKALVTCTKHMRKKHVNMLRKCSVAGWDPAYHWGGIEAAMEVIAP